MIFGGKAKATSRSACLRAVPSSSNRGTEWSSLHTRNSPSLLIFWRESFSKGSLFSVGLSPVATYADPVGLNTGYLTDG